MTFNQYICVGSVRTAITGLNQPVGIAVDLNGDVYVADGRGRICVYRGGMGNAEMQ